MPQVSVVIPAYNAMQYLPETLESVLKQTFTDFEVLIVNDGSSDNVIDWVSQVKDPRVKLISQTNQGLSGARNTGILNAQGEYVAFLDADDLWESSKLEKQVRCLNDNPEVGLVHTPMILVDEHGKSTGRVISSDAEGNVFKELLQRNFIACPSVIVRRSCFETVGVFNRSLRSIEDWDMWIRIASRYTFAVIKEPLSYYRQHTNNMSKNWQVMGQAFQQVIEESFQLAPEELHYLKNRSYAYANICLAWKALQCSDKDYQLAEDFLFKAVGYYHPIRYSRECIRLSLAIALMRYFGSEGYNRLLSIGYALRRRISAVIQ